MKHFLTLLLFTLSTSFTLQAQQSVKDTLAKKLENYFFLERENIHAQFNKSTFMTNEQVWFKGYVYHRKKNLPFYASVNIQANLMDASGTVIDSQLLYGNVGTFSGSFKLKENLASGRYYIQFFTNWMNNFLEDESSVYEVIFINPTTGAGNALAKADLSKINIDLFPEGGKFINGIANSFGVQVSDCNHEPVTVSVIDIADASGKVIQKVQVNKLGYGRFSLPAGTGTGYKAMATLEGVAHAQPFPAPAANGIAMEVNTLMAGKTIITLRATIGSITTYANKPLFLVLHKDDATAIYDVDFKGKPELKIALANNDLFDGINTIRLVDADLKQVAERMVYKYPESTLNTQLTATIANDTVNIAGIVNAKNMSLSIAVLPQNTRSFDYSSDIYGSLGISLYIKNQKKQGARYYFEALSRAKMYELDLYLQCQQSKYEWSNILGPAPKGTYPFDIGVTVKGSVPKSMGTASDARVRMYSITSSIDETTEVDKDGNFEFRNIFTTDSAYVSLTYLRKGQKPKELNVVPSVLNYNRKFYKPFTPTPRCFITGALPDETTPNFFTEGIDLQEVTIEKTTLKYAKQSGNSNLRAYKISEMQANMYQILLNFIKTYGGFNVSNTNGKVSILSRTITTINGAASGPIVYIDDMQQRDLDILNSIQLSEVDEIYMNPHAIVSSMNNFSGVIRIYRNKGAKGGVKNTTPEIILKNAFKKIPVFENVLYSNTADEGFVNFGVIDWKPVVVADENGKFSFTIPKTAQKTIKVIIEGFAIDGQLISEIKTITLP
jgi:hypothetical protein